MKKRIAKKKRNREIKDLAQKQRQKGNVTHVVWDSIEEVYTEFLKITLEEFIKILQKYQLIL